MIELLNKRSYDSKHFLHPTDPLKKIGVFHSGHIHYKDGEEFKEIDHALVWDDTKRGWGFVTHSYHPFLPEFSDGWAEFRDKFQDKDQLIRYNAICNSVPGVLIEKDDTNPYFDDNPVNKAVLYKNAFGDNKDLIYYNTRSSFVKVATVNNPNEQTKDVVFEWELELPDKEIFRVEKSIDAEEMTAKSTKTNTEDGKLVGYRLLKENGKNFNTAKQTLIGNSKLDGQEWYTYLKSYKAWDSDGNTIDIVARIDFVDGKVILKKTIPLEFLQNAVGRVFTDTTTSYYSDANSSDGHMYSGAGLAWSTLVSANGTGSNNTASNLYAGLRDNVNISKWEYIYRSRIRFNTSSLLSSYSITSATIGLYGTSKANAVGNSITINIFGSSSSSSTVVTTDYQACGSTPFSTSINYSGWTLSAFNTFSLNSSGKAAIVKEGYTSFSLREATYDATNTTPNATNSTNFDWFQCASKEATSNIPYLEVTYTEGGGSTYSLTATTTSFSVSSQTTGLYKSTKLPATVSQLTLSSQSVNLFKSYKLTATKCSYYTLVKWVNFTYVQDTGYSLTAVSAFFEYTAIDALILANKDISLTTGSFIITQQDISTYRHLVLSTVAREFLASSTITVIAKRYIVQLTSSSYSMTLFSVIFDKFNKLLCDVADITINLINTSLKYTGWTRRTKPSSSWTDRTKPTTVWTKI